MLLVYFIPYIYLFICYLVVGRAATSRRRLRALLGEPARGLVIGVARPRRSRCSPWSIATVPPTGYGRAAGCSSSRCIGGAGFFVVLGGLIYWRGRR